jgi:hypothetical protein
MGNAEAGLTAAGGLAPAAAGGMTAGMTSAKVAISLPKEVLAHARAAVRRGKAPSLSAYVSMLIEEKFKQDDLKTMLDQMLDETGGPPTPEEIRWADEALGLTTPTPKRRSRK